MEVAWSSFLWSGWKELKLFFGHAKRTSQLIEKDHLGDWSPDWGLLLATLGVTNNRPSITQVIFRNQGMLLLRSNHFLMYCSIIWWKKKDFWKVAKLERHFAIFYALTEPSSQMSAIRPEAGEEAAEIFRFELNSATKVEFCLLKWTAVNRSYSFQVLSIIVRLCTVVLLCNLEFCKGTKSYFCSAKNNQQL